MVAPPSAEFVLWKCNAVVSLRVRHARLAHVVLERVLGVDLRVRDGLTILAFHDARHRVWLHLTRVARSGVASGGSTGVEPTPVPPHELRTVSSSATPTTFMFRIFSPLFAASTSLGLPV
ncbi:hypothetical protein GCM10008949_16270 [Deinococcus humi]|nr:hypothetical protein GCM10008949_16270 [Deinococcus humi]